MSSKRAKFVETNPARIVECHLNAIKVAKSRTGLIEIYRAAKKTTNSAADLDRVITACKTRQAELLAQGIISL